MIQITHGSIFDSKCDLLIVPCNSNGGVTKSVFIDLQGRGLPTEVGPTPYGTVYFRELNYELANTMGYAASVNAETRASDSRAITRIAREIVRYAQENEMRVVNIPLLGSGAGGMSHVESFASLEKGFSKEDNTTFNIFCYARETFRNVVAYFDAGKRKQKPKLKSPRVFISYAGNDKENANWTKSLAETLRANGIDARLDVFHLKPGFDLPQWMTNEVIMADKVLLICDKYYMEKADLRKSGAGWETMIIQGDMLTQGDNKQKYIAIVREKQIEKALPIYMRSKYAFNWEKKVASDPSLIKRLILTLFNCDTEPELGKIPDYVVRRSKLSA